MQVCGVKYDILSCTSTLMRSKVTLETFVSVLLIVYIYNQSLVVSLCDCLQYCGHILNAWDIYSVYIIYAKLRPPNTLEVNLLLTSLSQHWEALGCVHGELVRSGLICTCTVGPSYLS